MTTWASVRGRDSQTGNGARMGGWGAGHGPAGEAWGVFPHGCVIVGEQMGELAVMIVTGVMAGSIFGVIMARVGCR